MILKPNRSDKETICSLQFTNELVVEFKFLTVKEVSEVLRVSTDTIYRLLDNRKLPFHMIGGCKRIMLKDLQHYLDQNKIQAQNENEYGNTKNK